ncbi:MAG: hypothetical protein E2O39_04375 [Planctomycetota bacterium]|nr:MAG: hypothetical protein E2O39_04375 [Planctomycetota bacterium]
MTENLRLLCGEREELLWRHGALHAREQEEPPPHDPEDGGDASLIRWLLSLSVGERLAVLQAQAAALARFRDAATQR